MKPSTLLLLALGGFLLWRSQQATPGLASLSAQFGPYNGRPVPDRFR